MEKQKTREEIEKKYTWNLDLIFKNSDEFEKAFKDIDSKVEKVLSLKGKIMENSDNLYNFYKDYAKKYTN